MSEYILPNGEPVTDPVDFLLLLADFFSDSPVGQSLKTVAREYEKMCPACKDQATLDIRNRFRD